MAVEYVNEMLEALAGQAGAEFRLDESGECVLEREDGTYCVVTASPQGNALAISTIVGFLQKEDGFTFVSALLQLNGETEVMSGGSLSLDRSGEIIVYRYISEAAALDAERFKTLLKNFFAVTDALRGEIAAIREAIEASDAESGSNLGPDVGEDALRV